jgi:hypothetical protein
MAPEQVCHFFKDFKFKDHEDDREKEYLYKQYFRNRKKYYLPYFS